MSKRQALMWLAYVAFWAIGLGFLGRGIYELVASYN
jgi:hypothetical protein